MSANIEQHSAQTGGKSALIVRDVLAGISKELQAVRRELADAQASASQMYRELGALEERLAASEKRGDMLQADLEEAAKLRQNLEDTVADAQARIQELSHENERVTTLEELIAEIKEKNGCSSHSTAVKRRSLGGCSVST